MEQFADGRRSDVAQVGQLRVNSAVFDGVRGDWGRELWTTFGISDIPFRHAQSGGQLHAEAIGKDALALITRPICREQPYRTFTRIVHFDSVHTEVQLE